MKGNNLYSIDEKHQRWLLRRGSYVSEKHKICYIKIPKAACTTMAVSMYYVEGIDLPNGLAAIHMRSGKPGEHVKSIQTSSVDTMEIIDGNNWFRFSFVRNPYDRLISAYKNKILQRVAQFDVFREQVKSGLSWYVEENATLSFHDFATYVCNQPNSIRNMHWRTQFSILRPLHINYHFIGRFERFSQDYHHVFSRVPGVDWSKVGGKKRVTSLKTPLPLAYSKDLADLVYQAYEEDFHYFNYSRTSWMSG